MNSGAKVIATVMAVVIFLAVWWIGMSFSCEREAVGLENRFKVTRQKVQGVFDNTWRIIEGKAAVASKYKDGLLEVVSAQTEGRKGGDVMKFVQEAMGPGLDPSLYRDVANAIEAQRTNFRNAEAELLAVVEQHNNLRQKPPSSWFVGGRQELVYDVITSARTNKTFETGRDESDVDPFRAIQAK